MNRTLISFDGKTGPGSMARVDIVEWSARTATGSVW